MLRALLPTAILSVCCACSNSSGKTMTANADTISHNASSAKVLVELFTSQGCSSCPSADKLMGNLMAADTNVIALSFHVDYWDRLGWKDVFSSHVYTLRQQQYVQALHAESLYTPQGVVQGKYEMVGSNRTRVADAINKAKMHTTNQIISAAATVNGNIINLHYQLSAMPANQQLMVALVQNRAATSVERGENAGNKLNDYNVVRSLQMQSSMIDGNMQLTLPDDLKKENASLVLFAQNEQTKEITTVVQLHL